ncbi:MAG: SDR family NAD(P)-dependent oxidoreductase, partial [Georgfuchsia sp.]
MQRTALVVGAAGGVGSEVVKQLLAKGYRVIATVLNQAEAARVAPGVEKTLFLDLSNADSIMPALQQQSIAALDAVVVCAAISPYGPLEAMPLDGLRRTLEINTGSNVAIYQASMPLLRASKGRILFISSTAGRVAMPFSGHYAGSKYALEGLGDVMRREAHAFGVDVILVEPGGIKTPMVVAQIDGLDGELAKLSPDHAALYRG